MLHPLSHCSFARARRGPGDHRDAPLAATALIAGQAKVAGRDAGGAGARRTLAGGGALGQDAEARALDGGAAAAGRVDVAREDGGARHGADAGGTGVGGGGGVADDGGVCGGRGRGGGQGDRRGGGGGADDGPAADARVGLAVGAAVGVGAAAVAAGRAAAAEAGALAGDAVAAGPVQADLLRRVEVGVGVCPRRVQAAGPEARLAACPAVVVGLGSVSRAAVSATGPYVCVCVWTKVRGLTCGHQSIARLTDPQ